MRRRTEEFKKYFVLNLYGVFLILILWVTAVIIHNLFYGIFWTEEPFFFLIATVIIPLYLLIAGPYTIYCKFIFKAKTENSLKSKVVVITGGNSGIGKETAFKFAKAGAKLIITYLKNKEEAAEVAEKCLELGAEEALIVELDLLKDKSIKKAVSGVIKKFGGMDILINNAGVVKWEKFENQSFEDIENQTRVNLEGLMKITLECLPYIKKEIINIASRAGVRPHPTAAPYCATKYGVRGFTQTLALEYPNLEIFAINPDTTATQMTDFSGRPPEQVAQVIFDAANLKFNVPSGSDINVWEVLGKK